MTSGSTSVCTLVIVTLNSASSDVPLGVAVNVELLADITTDEVIVELLGDPALADLVEPVLGVEPGHGLAVAGGGEVEGDVVARLDRALDRFERAVTAALGVDRLVDAPRGRRRRWAARPADPP